MKHVHSVKHTAWINTHCYYEICDCGATRKLDKTTKSDSPWHTCRLCTHAYGLRELK